MQDVTPLDCSRIAQDLQIRKVQVEAVVQLLDEGNTIPFITRYRKERTGGLNEDVLRQIQTRVKLIRALAERKQTILRSLETQGKLTDELREAIRLASTSKRLEDLYLPYKPKKKSLASAAREKGLEPLALALWHSDPVAANLDEMCAALVNPEKQLATADDVRTGVQHILAEMMAETADVRALVREVLWKSGQIVTTKNEKLPAGQGQEYKDYFDFKEAVQQIKPHRYLALKRAEREGAIKSVFDFAREHSHNAALYALSEHLLKVAGGSQPTAHSPQPAVAALEAGSSEAAGSGQQAAGNEQPTEGAAPIAEAAPSEAPVPTPEAPASELSAVGLRLLALQGDPLDGSSGFRTPHAAFFKTVLDDALTRLVYPSLEREIRGELGEEAEEHAVHVFAHNLRSLLLQPPLRGKRVLAIDPAFRTGCKLAALDEFGNVLEHTVVYPFGAAPGEKRERGRREKKSAAGSETTAPQDAASATPPETPAPEAPTPAAPPPEMPPTETPAPEVPPPEMPAPDAPAPATPTPEVAASAESSLPGASSPQPAAPAVDRRAEAKAKIQELVTKHQLTVAALGNGTGCRETEELLAELIAVSVPDLAYIVVNEAGASVYSVSTVGKEEFPDLDATIRSTISIGRRLQDPLSELVKIDPQSIGVGLYQHDVDRKDLKETLEGVVESCVNQVGVDVNTASVPLLRFVSGLNQLVARELVEYRKQHGPFTGRDQLKNVPNLGEMRFIQSAGFLKIPAAGNPFDRTWIHPESYSVAERILAELGFAPSVLDDKTSLEELQEKLKTANVEELAQKLETGAPTVRDILEALARPGRDPREDLPPPIFKKGILKLEDLQPGMELKGTVLNVVDFGAFVDIGLKDSGLVHISQMANRYIKSPYDVVAVNDIVKVWVLTVDKDRNRVSLTMIAPGTERKPPERQERRPQAPRGERREGPPPGGERREGAPPGDRGAPRGRGGPPGRGPRGPGGPGQGQQGGHGQQGQGHPAGEGRGRGGPPNRGRGGPPNRGPRPQDATPAQTSEPNPAPAPPPPPPPRKPKREVPKPKLTDEALKGKAPLRTLSELAAFFAARSEPEEKPKAAEPPAAAPENAASPETPHEPPSNPEGHAG